MANNRGSLPANDSVRKKVAVEAIDHSHEKNDSNSENENQEHVAFKSGQSPSEGKDCEKSPEIGDHLSLTDDFLATREPKSYKLDCEIGRGGYGIVFRAMQCPQQNTGNTVAIKVYKVGVGHTKSGTIERVATSSQQLIKLDHINLLKIHECFTDASGERLYLVSEYTDMKDLYNVLQSTNIKGNKIWLPLDEYQARHVIKCIANGLGYMHNNSISHADLKLENILIFWSENVTPEEKNKNITDFLADSNRLVCKWIPKIADFDSIKFRDSDTDPEGMIMNDTIRCTFHYAAPESLDGKAFDLISADCWSLGYCLLALILASRPFSLEDDVPNQSDPHYKSNLERYMHRCNQKKKDIDLIKQLIKHLSPQLRQVLEKLLNPDCNNRSSVDQFLSDPWFKENNHHQSRDDKPNQQFTNDYSNDDHMLNTLE